MIQCWQIPDADQDVDPDAEAEADADTDAEAEAAALPCPPLCCPFPLQTRCDRGQSYGTDDAMKRRAGKLPACKPTRTQLPHCAEPPAAVEPLARQAVSFK